jgi:alpha-glucosidase
MPQYFGKLQTIEQPRSIIGAVKSIDKTDRAIHFNCTNATLKISILAPNLIRVRMSPTGESKERSRAFSRVLGKHVEYQQIPFLLWSIDRT